MLTAHYHGPAREGLWAKAGRWLIRAGQKAPYSHITHTEAIHQVYADGTTLIASASLADGAVRVKRAVLRMEHWIIVDVPAWDVARSVEAFAQWTAAGAGYDIRGAAATMLPGKQSAHRLFCTEAVLAPFVPAAHYFTPAQGLAICLGHGRDVTAEFFSNPIARPAAELAGAGH